MGLDMYAFSFAPARLVNPAAQVDLEFNNDNDEPRPVTELAYWRKFNHLHGWMERLYREKNGTYEQFNCTSVRLTEEDLDKLEADWRERKLSATAGFFFGNGEWYPEYDDEIEAFLTTARAQLAEGKGVFYDSWW